MKKVLAIILTVIMTAAVFSACGGAGTASQSGPASSGGASPSSAASSSGPASIPTNEVDVSAPGVLPIVSKPVQLSIFNTQHTNVEDYDDNKMTKFMEEQTGVDIVWQLVPEKDQIQKVNLILASQTDLPDVFMSDAGLTNDMISNMAEQGVFIALDDMIAEQAYWYKEACEKDPLIEKIVKLPDGKQYTMPRIVKSVPNETSGRAWINQVWLDKLGLATPTTTDELAEVLRAFKTKDPNGNGKADEIPMMGSSVTGWNASPDQWMMNSFIQYNRDMPFYINNGQITASFAQEGYRKGLIFMNMLCKEGLLDPATFTQDSAQMKQIFANEDAALIGLATGGGTFQWDSMDGERVREYNPLSPVAGPDGVRLAWYNPYGSYGVKNWAITNACKNPVVAFKFADYMYSREVSMRNRLGEPGVDYLIPSKSEMAVDGTPATYLPVLLWGSIQKSHWNERGPAYNDFDNNCVKVDNPYELQQYLWNATKDYFTPYIPPVENCYNQLTFYTFEDARRLADIWATLKDYQREMLAKFATGVVDPNDDKDWDRYIKELESIGYLEYIKIMQARYDISNA